jgi:hypothetical protein
MIKGRWEEVGGKLGLDEEDDKREVGRRRLEKAAEMRGAG